MAGLGNRVGLAGALYEKPHVRCRTEAAAKYLRSNPAGSLRRPVQPQV